MSEFIDEAVQYLRILGRGVLADEVADLHKAAATLSVEKAELRAQVAALTAERDAFCAMVADRTEEIGSLEFNLTVAEQELSRVKALVVDAPTVAIKWAGILYRPEEMRGYDHGTKLIARPNLEQKP